METMLTFFLAGFVGGVIRGAVGILKYLLSYKDVSLKWWYFTLLSFISGLIGFICAWVIKELNISIFGIQTFSPALALIVGYAGGDFLENIFKIIIKKPIIFEK
ncbi:MAG TPA: hypothetical protein PLE40_02860 [Candidatus Pacearchaeota archaeon]|nr:hypothetical protein [Candidatus Pacearchaeota archaeon]